MLWGTVCIRWPSLFYYVCPIAIKMCQTMRLCSFRLYVRASVCLFAFSRFHFLMHFHKNWHRLKRSEWREGQFSWGLSLDHSSPVKAVTPKKLPEKSAKSYTRTIPISRSHRIGSSGQIQDGGRPSSWKYTNKCSSATCWQISIKFVFFVATQWLGPTAMPRIALIRSV